MELFSPLHLLVILFIFVLLFGPKKLPEMGRALGEGIKEFKKAMKEVSAVDPTETKASPSGSMTQTISQVEASKK